MSTFPPRTTLFSSLTSALSPTATGRWHRSGADCATPTVCGSASAAVRRWRTSSPIPVPRCGAAGRWPRAWWPAAAMGEEPETGCAAGTATGGTGLADQIWMVGTPPILPRATRWRPSADCRSATSGSPVRPSCSAAAMRIAGSGTVGPSVCFGLNRFEPYRCAEPAAPQAPGSALRVAHLGRELTPRPSGQLGTTGTVDWGGCPGPAPGLPWPPDPPGPPPPGNWRICPLGAHHGQNRTSRSGGRSAQSLLGVRRSVNRP